MAFGMASGQDSYNGSELRHNGGEFASPKLHYFSAPPTVPRSMPPGMDEQLQVNHCKDQDR